MSIKIGLFDLYGARGKQGKELVLGDVTIYFSYSTPVAYFSPDEGFVISENVWSVTTGGHLNAINSDKDIRISNTLFKEKLDQLVGRLLK